MLVQSVFCPAQFIATHYLHFTVLFEQINDDDDDNHDTNNSLSGHVINNRGLHNHRRVTIQALNIFVCENSLILVYTELY